MRAPDPARHRWPASVRVAGAAVAVGAAALLVSGLATAGVPGHGGGHTMAQDGSMVHGGVTYYAGPVPEAVPTEIVEGARPTDVAIPSIGVASPLLELGLRDDGTAEVPQDYALAGWFGGGGRPGLVGPTVLLGHVDSADGPAVFYRLRELAAGDVVEVTTAGGGIARYAVERVEQVAKDEFPTFEVFGATRDDVLRLVTCAGDFDRGERSYTDNLVVHATRL